MKHKLPYFFIIPVLFFLVFTQTLYASDTLNIRAHNKTHMNWYGNYDVRTEFPPADSSFKKITLKYTLGCPSAGCSDWDYTTRVFVRRPTNETDTLVQYYPNFMVNNIVLDSVSVSINPTYTTFYNSNTHQTDSNLNPLQKIIFYSDSLHPSTASDSIEFYAAGYFKYYYTAHSGQIVDSVFVPSDTTYYIRYWTDTLFNPVIEDIEIARYITPYSGNLTGTFSRTWEMDVTDYRSLFNDSTEIRVLYDGWSDGFTVTLDFEMIKGTPVRKAYKVEQLYSGFFPYGDPVNSIENYLVPKNIYVDSAAKGVDLRIIQTGHGFGGNQNCAEFCIKNNFVFIDSSQAYSNQIWKDDCGMNPMFPQPGTWLYDRANWCPGEMVRPMINDLTPFLTPGQTHSFDINMTPFTNVGNNNCGYYVAAQLIYFEEPQINHDIELLKIMAPSNEWSFNRINPVCGKGLIRVKNNGTDAVQGVDIEYGESGKTKKTTTWPGVIPSGGTAEIELEDLELTGNPNKFEVNILAANDQDLSNNHAVSTFVNSFVYPETFYVEVRTNNAGPQNYWELLDMNGNLLYNRGEMDGNTIYRDTVNLPLACYQFYFYDSAKDGLSFFANNDGSGYVRFKRMDGTNLRGFPADFGSMIAHQFSTNPKASVSTALAKHISVYPNPSTGKTIIDVSSFLNRTIQMRIYDAIGRLVLTEKRINNSEDLVSLDLKDQKSGIYFIELEIDKEVYREKLLLNTTK